MNKFEVVKKIESYPFSAVTEFERNDFLNKSLIGNSFTDSFLVEDRKTDGEIVVARSWDEYNYKNHSTIGVDFKLSSDDWMNLPGVGLGQLILVKGKINSISISKGGGVILFFHVEIKITDFEVINKPENYNPTKLIQQDIKEYESEIRYRNNKEKAIIIIVILLIVLFSIDAIIEFFFK